MRQSLHLLPIILCGALLLAACAPSSATAPTSAPPSPTGAPSPTAAPTAAPASPTAAAPSPTGAPSPTAAPTSPTVPTAAGPRYAAALVYGPAGDLSALPPEGGMGAALDDLPEDLDPSLMAVAPDGSALAYVSAGRALVRDLFTGRDENITPPGLDELPGGAPITGFHWSPDSRTVLYDLEQADSVADPRPVIVAAERGEEARVLGAGLGPSWSPDGRAIAYAGPPFEGSPPFGGGPGGRLAVAGAALDDSRPLALDAAVYPLFQPILWSPEGGRVAAGTAVLDMATGRPERVIAPADGEYLAAILRLGGPGEAIGLWRHLRTPDPADPGGFYGSHVFVSVAPDGAETTLAATPPSLCPCLPTARPDSAWSADGASLLVLGELDGMDTSGVWLVGDGGRSHLNLTPGSAPGGFFGTPVISPDGRYALVTEGRDGAPVAWAIPLTQGPQQPAELGAGWGIGWQ